MSNTQTYPKQYPFLTRQEFEVAAKSFLEQSKNVVGEGWIWIEHEKLKGFGYLSRKMIIQKVNDSSNEFKNEDITPLTTDDEQFDQIEEVEDPGVLNTSLETAVEYLIVDYHIIYSTSYKVPVLYFNAYHNDGTPLTNDEIYSCLIQPSRLEDIKIAGFHGGISQQDHPTLLIPFYYLHPCETATLMKSIVDIPRSTKSNSDYNILQNKISIEGYVRSWLSLVGNVVGLKIEIDYFL